MTNYTVRECMINHPNMSYYLIPNILLNQKFDEPKHLYGHEVTNINMVHKDIIDKKVIKTWIEDECKRIIVWENLKFDGKKYLTNNV